MDLTPDDMYKILNTCKELPTTAHLNMVDFVEEYQKAAEEGYTDIIYMGLNSHGSATYQSAVMGKKLFYEHLPQYAGTVRIHPHRFAELLLWLWLSAGAGSSPAGSGCHRR